MTTDFDDCLLRRSMLRLESNSGKDLLLFQALCYPNLCNCHCVMQNAGLDWFYSLTQQALLMFFFFLLFFKKYQSTIIILTLKNINSYVPSLEEECESSLCTAALRAMNMNLQNDMKKLTAIFEKLHTYISLLALPSKCGLWATTIQDSL